jgi:C_GCAxxG_C_C family probable redox protein
LEENVVLVDKVKKYYNKEVYDLNCAETMLYAANEEYSMNFSKETLKTVAAFGGGMAIESVCGAITGALAVIGILFTKEKAHESDKIKNLTMEFFNEFQKKLGTFNCKELKEKYKTDELRCGVMVEEAALILDEIINKEDNKNNL